MLGLRLQNGRRASNLKSTARPQRARSASVKSNGSRPATDSEASEPRYIINEIPRSAWPDGVPPVMGAHLMPSGDVAPISTSKVAGDQAGTPHSFHYHTHETKVHRPAALCAVTDCACCECGLFARLALL